jgi:hypothetical protein
MRLAGGIIWGRKVSVTVLPGAAVPRDEISRGYHMGPKGVSFRAASE